MRRCRYYSCGPGEDVGGGEEAKCRGRAAERWSSDTGTLQREGSHKTREWEAPRKVGEKRLNNRVRQDKVWTTVQVWSERQMHENWQWFRIRKRMQTSERVAKSEGKPRAAVERSGGHLAASEGESDARESTGCRGRGRGRKRNTFGDRKKSRQGRFVGMGSGAPGPPRPGPKRAGAARSSQAFRYRHRRCSRCNRARLAFLRAALVYFRAARRCVSTGAARGRATPTIATRSAAGYIDGVAWGRGGGLCVTTLHAHSTPPTP